jgi:hypothetical protein
MLFFRVSVIGENRSSVLCKWLPQMIDATFAQSFYRVEKYLPEDGLPPLRNAVWAWDTKLTKLNTDLVDNQTIFPLD